jgi:hypothetical protein
MMDQCWSAHAKLAHVAERHRRPGGDLVGVPRVLEKVEALS